ncbi:unnamed protein product, partial [Mesorhabditis spiculigera]
MFKLMKKKKPKDQKTSAEDRKPKTGRKSASATNSVQQSIVAIERQAEVRDFCQAVLQLKVSGIEAAFQRNPRKCDMKKCTVFSRNQAKNRYKDVGCLDDGRVILRDNGGNDYIHANYVATPENPHRFICCQAPLESTCADHWKMIVQDGVEVILMLCDFLEKNLKKCAEYFPMDPASPKTFGPYTIHLKKKEMMKWECQTQAEVVVSHFTVEVDGRQVHQLTHYHWQKWPDRGVPTADQALIYLLKTFSQTEKPIVVHCSAGIGRTGSIVLIQYILESINAGSKACNDVEKLLTDLRKQRANSVQTHHQYLFVHQVLLNYFYKEGFLDKSVEPFIAAFSAAYEKATSESKDKPTNEASYCGEVKRQHDLQTLH